MKKYIIWIFVFFSVLVIANASQTELGTYTQNECVTLIQLCGDCTFNNITSVIYPNATVEILDSAMTQRGVEFNYSFCTTNDTGKYLVNGVGDLGGVNTVWAYDFYVTENGREEPDGYVIVMFALFFVIIFSWLIITMFNNLGHFAHIDLDIIDIAYSISGYCALLALYYFCGIYFPKAFVLSIGLMMIKVTFWTHLFLPLIIFIFVLLKNRRIDV